jgi:hypothetical protein
MKPVVPARWTLTYRTSADVAQKGTPMRQKLLAAVLAVVLLMSMGVASTSAGPPPTGGRTPGEPIGTDVRAGEWCPSAVLVVCGPDGGDGDPPES